MTTIEKIFAARPTKPWAMLQLSANPGLGIHMMQMYPHMNWDKRYMSSKLNCMPEHAIDWTVYDLCDTLHFLRIVNAQFVGGIDWSALCRNSTVTMQTVLDHADLSWDWKALSDNPNITAEIAVQYPQYNWDWHRLSARVKWQTVMDNPDLPWNWARLSSNPGVTWSYVESHNHDWDWNALSINLNITLQDIRDNPTRNWNTYGVCRRPDVDFANLPHDVNWMSLSGNLALTMQVVLSTPGNWNWNALSCHPMNKLSYILANPHLPWDCESMAGNPNLTMDYVLSRTDWNYKFMSSNYFEYSNRLRNYHILRMRRLRARNAFRIRGWYRLYLLTRTSRFLAWYCAEGGVGRRVDHARIRHAALAINNKN